MKALKFLFIVVLLSFFSFNSSFGQENKNKTVDCYDVPQEFVLWCTGEVLTGNLKVCVTTWVGKKTQIKFKGTLTAETTGNVYTVSQVTNDNWFPYTGIGQFNANYVVTLSIELDGMPVATLHETWHVTRNAKGEVTTFFDHFFTECY